LAPGETYEHAPIVIRKLSAEVAGIVVDPDGNPVENVTISARDRKTHQFIPLTRGEITVTGKDGKFIIRNVPDVPLSLMAYIRTIQSSVHSPATADADPGQTDVRILLDPKLSRSNIRRITPRSSTKE